MYLLILPGFGLHAEDYESLVSESGAHAHTVFDVWPRNVDEVYKLGAPKSDSYESWISTQCSKLQRLLLEIRDKHDNLVIFAHSAGGEFVRRLRLSAICFGCKKNGSDQRVIHVCGTHDKLVEEHEGDVVVRGGHFGIVSKEAYERASEFQAQLGLSPLQEVHVNACAEVGRIIREYS